MHSRPTRLIVLALVASACGSPSAKVDATVSTQDPSGEHRLPTGAKLDPAGASHDLGPLPLAMALSPDKSRVVILMNGWRDQGIQVVDRATGNVVQTVSLPAVFLGIAFSRDGRSLWVSGGNQDVIYRFDWSGGKAALVDSIQLAVKQPDRSGTRYPAGIGISRDGRTIYAA